MVPTATAVTFCGTRSGGEDGEQGPYARGCAGEPVRVAGRGRPLRDVGDAVLDRDGGVGRPAARIPSMSLASFAVPTPRRAVPTHSPGLPGGSGGLRASTGAPTAARRSALWMPVSLWLG